MDNNPVYPISTYIYFGVTVNSRLLEQHIDEISASK